jgi:hypothetical protein
MLSRYNQVLVGNNRLSAQRAVATVWEIHLYVHSAIFRVCVPLARTSFNKQPYVKATAANANGQLATVDWQIGHHKPIAN